MTRPELIAALTGQGWTYFDEPCIGGACYKSGDRELLLQILTDGSWDLMGLTDSDRDGVATGRYRTIDEGESLADVLEAVKCAAMGIPRDVDERDLGEVYDGGVEDIEREIRADDYDAGVCL